MFFPSEAICPMATWCSANTESLLEHIKYTLLQSTIRSRHLQRGGKGKKTTNNES